MLDNSLGRSSDLLHVGETMAMSSATASNATVSSLKRIHHHQR
jgi:hypothetical protein